MKKINIFYIVTICLCLALDLAILVLSFLLPKFFDMPENVQSGIAVVISTEEREEGLFVKAMTVPQEGEGEEITFTIARKAIREGADIGAVKEGVKIEYGLDGKDLSRAVALTLSENKQKIADIDTYNQEAKDKIFLSRTIGFVLVVVLFLVAGFCLLKLCGFFKRKKW